MLGDSIELALKHREAAIHELLRDRPDLTFALADEYLSLYANEDTRDWGADGREAINHLLRGARPGLILLDLAMPVLSGWGFRAEQRLVAEWLAIPVVLVSAEGELAAHAADLGVQAFLSK